MRKRGGWDGEDFDALVHAYRPGVFRFVLSRLRDRDAADIVTQDCFLRAWAARARFRQECSAHTWLMQIAVNLIRDYARNRRLSFWRSARELEPRLERAGADCSPESRILWREDVAAVWRAARRLPDRQRTIFRLRFARDMNLLEIAGLMGLKEGTVKTHLSRAVRAIRQQLRAA